jgi:hypothetical protein
MRTRPSILSAQLHRDVVQPLLSFCNLLIMPPVTQPIASVSVRLSFHLTTRRRPPNHRRRRMIITRLPLSFGPGQVLPVCTAWDCIIIPENPSSLQFGYQKLDYIGESAGHEGIGLELLGLMRCQEIAWTYNVETVDVSLLHPTLHLVGDCFRCADACCSEATHCKDQSVRKACKQRVSSSQEDTHP